LFIYGGDLRVLILLFASIVSVGAVAGQSISLSSEPGVGIEEVYLAKDDGHGKAGEQVSEFKVTDVPIYCVVLLESIKSSVVKMNFVAVSVAGVKPETKVVTASYTTKEGQNRVNFTGRPDGTWTPGKYRVDLYVDGKFVKDLEFVIRTAPKTMEAKFLQAPSKPQPKPKESRRTGKPRN
jgi:hypothetical protein